jgi:hypothetical protein
MPSSPRNLRLDDALALPGCPVCRIVDQRIAQTIENIQDELVLDPGYRKRVDGAWGFCSVHAQMWLDQAQPLSTAIIYEAVLGRVTDALERATSKRPIREHQIRARMRGGSDGPALAATDVCPLCVTRDEQERLIAEQLLEELQSEGFRERYLSSGGLCVAHMNLALGANPGAETLAALRDRMLQTHEELRGQLREIIRKHAYRHLGEPPGAEWKAVEASVRHVAGVPGIDGR